MQIKTTAIAFNADSFHSNKTNQDYHRMGLLLEGAATNFFVSDKVWAEVVKQPWFNAVCASHEPTKVGRKVSKFSRNSRSHSYDSSTCCAVTC